MSLIFHAFFSTNRSSPIKKVEINPNEYSIKNPNTYLVPVITGLTPIALNTYTPIACFIPKPFTVRGMELLSVSRPLTKIKVSKGISVSKAKNIALADRANTSMRTNVKSIFNMNIPLCSRS